jgi:nitrous oxide reductase accessory protein NosL
MSVVKTLFFTVLLLLSFNGCEKKQITTELREVHWDRDMCERCKMVTSDRHHAVQVIDPKTGKSYMFDDIGCALLWFEDEKISWKDQAKVWITDVDTGKWIDARTAFYDAGNVTPMAYGFAAHAKKEGIKEGKEVLSYDALLKQVRDIEEKNNSRRAY